MVYVRANKLCIPASSAHMLLLQEWHVGGLTGHFSVKKTDDIVNPHGLYVPLSIPDVP
jgi:hypothetical protein